MSSKNARCFDVVTVGESIPVCDVTATAGVSNWSIQVGQYEITKSMVSSDFDTVDINVDSTSCKAYQLLWLVAYDSDEAPKNVEVVLQDGTVHPLDSAGMLFSYIVVEMDREMLDQPLYAFLDTLEQADGDKL